MKLNYIGSDKSAETQFKAIQIDSENKDKEISVSKKTINDYQYEIDTINSDIDLINSNIDTIETNISNKYNTTLLSADYTILDTDKNNYLITTSTSNVTITLPILANNIGREISIWKIDSGTGRVFIKTSGSTELINGIQRDGAIGNTTTSAIPAGVSGYGGIGAQYHGLKIKIISSTFAIILEHYKPYEKVYIIGQTYNGVSLAIVSGAFGSSGYCIPYQTIDGTWKLKLYISFGNPTAFQSATLTMSGVVYALVGEPLYGYINTSYYNNCRVASQSTIILNSGGSSTTGYIVGDLSLSAKPTWAD